MRILRGLSGRVLDCGCLVGFYETHSGEVVATIDARGPVCDRPSHLLHREVRFDESGSDESPSARPLAPNR